MEAFVGAAFGAAAAVAIAAQAIAIRLATRRGRMLDVLLFNLVISSGVFLFATLVVVEDVVITPTSFLAFAASGIVSLLLGRAFYFAGIQRVGASRSEPIKSSMPLHATVFAVVFLGERVTGLQFGGIVLIILGVALVTWDGTAADRFAGRQVPWSGLALPFLAALLFGLEPVLAIIGFGQGTGVLTGAMIQTTTAAVILLVALAWHRSVPRMSELPTGEVRWYVVSGVASVGAILTYYAGLNVSRVGVVVPISQTSPLIVAAVSILFLGKLERVSLRLVIASGVIIIGAAAVTIGG